jgi:GDPmannose 4,6-dehydratase
MKTAIVVGNRGQDGSLMTWRLEQEGYRVIGIGRTTTDPPDLLPAGIADRRTVVELVGGLQPAEIYYLASYHHAAEEEQPDPLILYDRSFATHVTGLLNFLEAIRLRSRDTRLIYAGSSHVFGRATAAFLDESTPLNPSAAYGITKTAGIHCCRQYRDELGLFAAAAILFNHESPLRRREFVSQKIIRGTLDILQKRSERLLLGDLSARVDWGYAPDFVDAMVRICREKQAGDFVVATGESHSVHDFVGIVFGLAGLTLEGHVEEKREMLRKPVRPLVGDAGKLRRVTGWSPSVSFEEMVTILWRAAMREVQPST